MRLNRKNWKYKLLIAAASLILLEILLRIFGINDTYSERVNGKYLTYWGKKHDGWYHTGFPNSANTENNIDFTYIRKINSLGQRELEPEQVFAGSAFRGIAVGDSYTEGVGVVYDSSFVRHIERIFKTEQIPVSFYNAGNAGSDPFYGYTILRDKLLQYHPQVVIEVINSSDYTDFIYRGGFERFKSDSSTVYKQAPKLELLYRHCYVFRMMLNMLGFMGGDLLMREKDFMRSCEDINQEFVAVADSFHALSVKHDFKMLFVIHPGPYELFDDNSLNRFSKQILRDLNVALKAKGYYSVNLWEPMGKVINEENHLDYGFKHDGHYSSAGYKLMAKTIFEETGKSYPDFWETKVEPQSDSFSIHK